MDGDTLTRLAMTPPTGLELADSKPPNGPILRYHGGKWRLAPWLLQFFPQHRTYVEAFGGAAGVLLQKARSYAEVYNDLDGDVVSFFQVLRDAVQRAALIDAIALTPYARAEFELAWQPADDPVERARRLAIRAAMGFGSAGATKQKTGFRTDTQRPHCTAQHAWLNLPDILANAGDRLRGVLIENRDAEAVLRAHDSPETLHFVDPPYLPETRVLRGHRRYYRHELTSEQHQALLETLCNLRGMVVLCGYAAPLYDQRLADWTRKTATVAASGRRGSVRRQEVVWLNPACNQALMQQQTQLNLFDAATPRLQ